MARSIGYLVYREECSGESEKGRVDGPCRGIRAEMRPGTGAVLRNESLVDSRMPEGAECQARHSVVIE